MSHVKAVASITSLFFNHFQDHFNPSLPCTFHYQCPVAQSILNLTYSDDSLFNYYFYPIILYIWGPDTLSGRPSVHALLTTSHNCFNSIVCTVKSNNNNNIGRECRRWMNRTEESIIALVLFELVLEASIDWEKTCILNHLKTIKSSKLKEKE